ncbi:hypothetical protein D3C81_1941300 [compost metagenome]
MEISVCASLIIVIVFCDSPSDAIEAFSESDASSTTSMALEMSLCTCGSAGSTDGSCNSCDNEVSVLSTSRLLPKKSLTATLVSTSTPFDTVVSR